MKKLLLLFLAMVLLIACSKKDAVTTKDDATDIVTLRIGWLGDGSNKEKLDTALMAFTEKTGIKLETVYIPGTWGEYFMKIQTMSTTSDIIDLASVAIEGFEMFIDMGLAQPLNAFAEKNKEAVDELMADVPTGIAAPFTKDGDLFGFPMSYNNMLMHFNTARLKKDMVEIPAADWGIEEFLALCKKLTYEEDGMKKYAVAIPGGNFERESWLRNNGTGFMNADFTKSTINSPESIEIFQLWQDLVWKYGYAPIPEPNVTVTQQFIDGTIAMYSSGRWPMFTYDANEFKDVALQYLPSFKVNQVQFGVDGMLVTSVTKHYEKAAELALWMASDEFIRDFFTIGNIPARRSLAKEIIPLPGYPKNSEIFYKDVDNAVPVSAPIAYAACAAIADDAFSKIIMEQAEVKETLDYAAKQMNKALAR